MREFKVQLQSKWDYWHIVRKEQQRLLAEIAGQTHVTEQLRRQAQEDAMAVLDDIFQRTGPTLEINGFENWQEALSDDIEYEQFDEQLYTAAKEEQAEADVLLNRVVMERTETPARLAALVGEQLANVGDTNVIAIAQELLADVDAIEEPSVRAKELLAALQRITALVRDCKARLPSETEKSRKAQFALRVETPTVAALPKQGAAQTKALTFAALHGTLQRERQLRIQGLY